MGLIRTDAASKDAVTLLHVFCAHTRRIYISQSLEIES
jgi:hypothetical protein